MAATIAQGRTILRRRTLPGTRAVAGGFLVAAAMVGAFTVANAGDSGPTEMYVVAGRDLVPGSRLAASDLRLVPIDVRDGAVRGRLFRDIGALTGASVVSPLGAGEPVAEGDVVGRGSRPGMREVSFAVESARAVGGTLKVGESIDLLGTFGSGADSWTAFLASGLRVIAIERPRSALGEGGALVVTVEARSPDEAAAVANASVASQITVVRSSDAPDGGAVDTRYRPPSAP